ncbi:Unsaturated glucuronyl hydrolase [Labeo rohita]|uniref:Unsaturated glucuronyl hydrolase n=1 Tax=Labeo rohita TaxID=84645 RepID=A0ABQ8LB10_LABRO|nr:Unsaturated glucuronyl hydrolase [Labeo rohita]
MCNCCGGFGRSLVLRREGAVHWEHRVKTFEQNEDVYTFLILPKYSIFFIYYSPSEAAEDTYMFLRRQNIFKFQKVSPSALDASFFLLRHRWAFEPCVVVACGSLGCPRCGGMDLGVVQSLLETVRVHRSAEGTRSFWDLGDFI